MNNQKVEVRNAIRKTKRDIRKVFSDNFLKILTEVVLNADDSYKRLETITNDESVKTIEIFVNRKDKIIKVIDNAEGMTADQMERIFGEYGGDYSGGDNALNVRGLFGQGAADVMFNAALSNKISQIESIKDNEVSKCKFYFENTKYIESKVINPHMKQYREKVRIQDNGTIVTFGLHDKVHIPSKKDMVNKIEEFYMFRYILSNDKRKVVLYDSKEPHILSSKRFLPDKKKILLDNKSISWKYDERKITAALSLFESNSKDNLKIIVRDENYVVYDDTFFGLERLPGARLVTGELVITGLAKLLRDLLNSEEPKELITDSRDGFDGREEFTKNMFKAVGSILEKEIEKNNSKRETISINLSQNKKFNDIMKKINKYYSDLELSSIEGINPGMKPPSDGLSFARSSISITKGKTYDLKLYINPEMIKDGELIRISHKGSDFFTTDNEIISYKTEDIKENNLVVKSVVIRSSRITDEPITLIARCKEYETIALVSVIEEKIIYPKGGLEFFPKRKKIKPNSRTEIRLYFDLDFIPMGSNIEILQTYDARLLEDRYIVQIKPNNIISDNIGFLKIKINSDDLEDKISLSANCNDIRAEAVVYVRLKDDDKAGNSGFLKRIELRFEDDWWQTSLIDNKGVLYINGMHVINRNILGDLGQEDHNNPSFKKDQRKYLYELIAVESAKRIVSDLVERGQIRFDQPRALFDNFQEHKTMIYLEIAEM